MIIVLFSIFGVLLAAGISFYLFYVRLWFRSFVAQAPVSIPTLLSLSLHRINPVRVVDAYTISKKNALNVSLDQITGHARTGGDVRGVVEAMRTAKAKGANASFEALCAEELAGGEALETSHTQAGS